MILSVAIAFGIAALMVFAIKGRTSQIFGRSVHAGDKSRRAIALTFDDGPSPGTSDLLEILKAYDVRATFFMCGANVKRHPEIARQVALAGHEIGNHTFTHLRLCPRIGFKMNLHSRREIYEEFSRTQSILQQETGITPVLLRAPYGLRWFGLRYVQSKLHLLEVMWTVIGRDWELDADNIAKLVLTKTRPGGIICLHDGRDIQPHPDIRETLSAVKQIIVALRAEDYLFQTVSELLQVGPAKDSAKV
jgi:peptidoglycan/xylan/chitin deacetylase (PgdA/CDA1 family)